jgi:outer membrane protein assembly factor BamE
MALVSRFYARFGLVAAALSLLNACASRHDSGLFGLITPYRMEVVQGNVVTQEMASKLRNGLTREQVRALLGAPLLMDIFHADRWDYVFTIRRQGAAAQQRRVTVLFNGDRVVSFEAAQLPSEREFVDSIDVVKVDQRARPLALSDDQLRALPLPSPGKATPAAQNASGPLRTYPPLEPLTAR